MFSIDSKTGMSIMPTLVCSPTAYFKRNSCRPNTVAAHSSSLHHAAKHTVDTYIESGMVIGLGSGHASAMAIQYLGRQFRAGALRDIVGIPMSTISASEAAKAGIPLDQYRDGSQIDFAFDDADLLEEQTLLAVIGRENQQGVESIIQEKSILNAANRHVFMITEKQYKSGLDGSIPVLIQSLGWMEIAEQIDDLFIGDAEVWRRSSIGQLAGPLGGDFPLVTGEGYNVLDVIFTSPIKSLAEVAESLDKVEGVVDHGIICKWPCTAVIVSDSGLSIVSNPSTDTKKGFS
ncbi:probable ribose-5-phosphate isomerase 4, chloroplastic [Mercurialis annua]|uniref:probable ribose-5-phosphate isomerase 4, chloroplastic n=1 Tax=Mercurialis annua TaxID=3986 RepID=UPI002160060F|nr:probable ribose-5-phosphate isomerase 4, chloroplastic [Mercurialis annua]XP_050223535.1 probable ribose-5-phosphate isomerase 4, chloroplastic [Mercurialis annua]